MSKERSDDLYTLIKSLKKSEKRYFKVLEGEENDRKFLRLFNIIDQQTSFNDLEILQSDPTIKESQLSNLKAHLYQKILKSLRSYNGSSVPSIKIHNLIDYAQILFNKGLYGQCAHTLKKAKRLAIKSDNLELQLEILKWEKQVLSHSSGTDNQVNVNNIIAQVQEVNNRINNINKFSNLHVKLQSLYRKIGFVRNERDFKKIQNVFIVSFPEFDEQELSISEKIGLYNLYIGYYFFIQDFEQGYVYAKKWVGLFQGEKTLILSKLEMYITGLNNLLIAQNKLYKYHEFQNTRRELRALNNLSPYNFNENIRLRLLKYTYVHEFNRLFMVGDFDRGVELIERIKPGLEQFISQLDPHSRVILFYKTACLYFGHNDFKSAIHWLNKIINSPDVDLREDIHGFARILNLISHFELGNIELIEYYVRSTYRFLLKKEDLHQYQKYILNFLKKLSSGVTDVELIVRFKKLRSRLLPLTRDPYERRPFIYFDIISWLESKIEHRLIKDIIREKAFERNAEGVSPGINTKVIV